MSDPIVILGAGPTGLGCAHRLEELGARDWLLFEAGREAGGLAASVRDERGFTWDLGGHVQFSHYPFFDDLMDELLGPEGWLYHDRESWVWVRGRFVPYPFQLNVGRLPREEALECLRGLHRAAARPRATPPANFDEWIEATFGAGVARVFMRPYNFKVWAYPPADLSWGWIGDRVAVTDFERVLENVLLEKDDVSWGPNNRFRFPLEGGTGAIWRALSARLPAEKQRFGRRAVALDTARRTVRFETGEEVRYRALVSTIPLDLLAGMSDLTDLAPVAARLVHSSTHVIGVGLAGAPPASIGKKCWMYFPEDDCPFYRVTVFSNYSPRNVPGPGYWSLMAEVSESPKKPVDAARVVEDTLAGMRATRLIEPGHEVVSTFHVRLEHGYPTPSLGRDEVLARVQPALEERGVYSRGRFGAWLYEVSNQDHSCAQGREVAERLVHGTEETTIRNPALVNARRGR